MDDKNVSEVEDYRRRISTGLEELQGRIAAAARRAGRDPASIELVAVSKFHPIGAVEAALNCGIHRFAESRVQEAESKFPELRAKYSELRLDLIGHLQGNKVRRALSLFDRIQSIDSIELIESIIAKIRDQEEGLVLRPLELLLELHTAEDSKGGFPDADSLRRACEFISKRECPSIALRGLMTMAPQNAGEKAVRASFAQLRMLGASVATEFALPRFDVLSMGMSGDFETAIEEGATEIRIGTALFGGRPP